MTSLNLKWISAWYRSRLAPNGWCPIDNKRKPRSNTEGLATLPCQSPIAPVSPQHPLHITHRYTNLTPISLIPALHTHPHNKHNTFSPYPVSLSKLLAKIRPSANKRPPPGTSHVSGSSPGLKICFLLDGVYPVLVSQPQSRTCCPNRLPYQPLTRLVDLVLNLLFRFLPRLFTLNVHRALSNHPVLPLEQGSADSTPSHPPSSSLALVLTPWTTLSLSRNP